MTKTIALASLYPLRAAALSTDDQLVARVLLGFLGETQEEARQALADSCWGEDLVPGRERELLRAALK